MTANDELAGRMARMDAARLRGVLPPDELVVPMPQVTPPRPAGIPWVPIADMQEAWKDGREVLLWVPGTPREPHQFGRYAGAEAPELDYWLTGENIPLRPTHVAAINPPEGL